MPLIPSDSADTMDNAIAKCIIFIFGYSKFTKLIINDPSSMAIMAQWFSGP
jgi:hypothetical protein